MSANSEVNAELEGELSIFCSERQLMIGVTERGQISSVAIVF